MNPVRSASAGHTLLLALVVVAGLAAWIPAHRYYQGYPHIIEPDPALLKRKYSDLTETEKLTLQLSSFSWRARETGVVIAILGVALGAATGLHAAWMRKRRSLLGVIGALALGMVAGGGFGMLSGMAGQWIFEQLHAETFDPLPKTMCFHAAAFAILGFGIGLAHGTVAHRRTEMLAAAIHGGLGGIIGGLLFAPIASAWIPSSNTSYFVPTGMPGRLAWFLFGSVAIALGITTCLAARPLQDSDSVLGVPSDPKAMSDVRHRQGPT